MKKGANQRVVGSTASRILQRMFLAAAEDNLEMVGSFVKESGESHRVLDLGCWDGTSTRRYLAREVAVVGIERSPEACAAARANNVVAVNSGLEASLPFRDAAFDLVTSNQVIEHLADTDLFLAEIHRVLRPGGVIVVSTENMASWHNIAALLFGWQAFSLTNISRRRGAIGNPLALLRDGPPPADGWEHVRILSFRGLRELLEAHGFVDVRVKGAGYYPLPSRVAHLEPRHSAFITACGRKGDLP